MLFISFDLPRLFNEGSGLFWIIGFLRLLFHLRLSFVFFP
jgi:hypothetical protein